ncbi:MAG: 50S ribosomal protein L29 [Coprobacillus sp.]|nr:50S ribosomal protein L29 [Coprobacillus sp.]
MRISEVRALSTEELSETLYSLKEQLFDLRRKKAVGGLERGEDITEVRRDIARVNMVISERKLGINKELNEGAGGNE